MTPTPALTPTPDPTPAPSPTPTTTSTPTPAPLAPSGQATSSGLLPDASLTFPSSSGGWVGYAGGQAAFADAVGRTAAGALAVTTAGPWTGAASASFAVAPGARYTVNGFVRADAAGATMALALRFRDANGTVIQAGTQVAQGVLDDPSSWNALGAAIGFAPANAMRGEIDVITSDAPAGQVQVHYADDLSVTQTTGTAAPLAGPLVTSGRDVLDTQGRKVTFRGIHIDGMQSSRTRVIATDELLSAQAWGANFIRLPLAENFATPGDCAYDPTYLPRVDDLVSAATSRGMFLMIDLHTLALTQCAAPTPQKMPDVGAVDWWKAVATRYQGNPLVGFDLYNEPHDVTDAVWRDGGQVSSSGVTYTAAGMQALYDAVRSTGATNLVFVSGNNWANTYPASAPLSGTSNLVYAVHAYTCPSGTEASGATCTPGPGGVLDPTGILRNFAGLGMVAPVAVTEFGWPNKYEGRYLANVIDYATSHGWSGWSAFAFDGTTAGMFDLVKDTGPLHDPAISGMVVMTRMLTS